MSEIRRQTEEWGKQWMPYILLGVCALLGLLLGGGLVGLILLGCGFGIGQFSILGRLPWAESSLDRQEDGEKLLEVLQPKQLERIQTLVKGRREVEAIKQLQALTGAEPREVKGAIEFLRQGVGAR